MIISFGILFVQQPLIHFFVLLCLYWDDLNGNHYENETVIVNSYIPFHLDI